MLIRSCHSWQSGLISTMQRLWEIWQRAWIKLWPTGAHWGSLRHKTKLLCCEGDLFFKHNKYYISTETSTSTNTSDFQWLLQTLTVGKKIRKMIKPQDVHGVIFNSAARSVTLQSQFWLCTVFLFVILLFLLFLFNFDCFLLEMKHTHKKKKKKKTGYREWRWLAEISGIDGDPSRLWSKQNASTWMRVA